MEHKTLIGLEGARSHRAANAIDKLASALEAITNAISVVVLTAMIIVIFFSVIARYVFSEGISWSEEFAIWGFTWLIFIGVAWGFAEIAMWRLISFSSDCRYDPSKSLSSCATLL